MTSTILILDLETTGLDGIENGDEIVEVSVASVDLSRQKVKTVFTAPVHHDHLTQEQEHSFIFREGYMETDDVYNSPFEEDKLAVILANILDGEYVTTFNTEFDLDKFLLPWFDKVIPEVRDILFLRAPCIMKAAAQVDSIPRRLHADMSCYPSLAASYNELCASDYTDQLFPHHAEDDCIMAGRVLQELYDRGLYDPEREEEY